MDHLLEPEVIESQKDVLLLLAPHIHESLVEIVVIPTNSLLARIQWFIR